MSQPTDPTRPSAPRDPGGQTPGGQTPGGQTPGSQPPVPGRRASDSRQTFPVDAPTPPTAPPPAAGSAAGLAAGSATGSAAGPTIVPQIGSQQGQPGQQSRTGQQGQSSQAASQERSGQYGQQSASAGTGAAFSQQPATGQPQSAGQHPAPGQQPVPGQQSAFGQPSSFGSPAAAAPQQRRRGPGWSALVAAAVAAALVGGALGGGGAWLLSSDSSPVAQEQQSPQQDSPAPGDQSLSDSTETPDWAQIADKTMPGVVSIQVGVGGEVSGLGSGFVYDDQGHIITNNHVIAPADTDGGEVQAVLSDGSMIPAALVGRDPETDIAVIKLDTVPDTVTPLPIGDAKNLFVGDPVMALGNPLGLSDTVTTGIVSALNRPVTTENIGDVSEQEVAMTITNAIQTDAAINPGNSGGPLVNGNGEVVGINSSAATLSDPSSNDARSGSIGIGFAITIEQATTIADQLIETGAAKHPLLGVTMVNSTVEVDGLTRGSAKVTAVENGSAAAAAGFEVDDEIIVVGDQPVNSGVSLQALVRSSAPGEPVEFTVVRGGTQEQLSATLEMR